MTFSQVGKKRVVAHVTFLLTDIVVLALAARVNQFQDFFFMADLFPLGLSIATFILLVVMLGLDFALENSYIAHPRIEIPIFVIMSILWLAFSAFSTSRWHLVPLDCSIIPAELAERAWCKDLQALKAFVWLNFLLCLFITLFTIRYTMSQLGRGNRHILRIPLSRYTSEASTSGGRSSEFLQFEKFS
ncbi:hypothetical protein BDQ17DRAFT_1354438 [Cyathus striatus]|nr:hypothetical protein BDQ17DRAFT_1354438 [Cyathus striatus]